MAKSLEIQVQELYVAYLGRAAEQEGQTFWVNGINAGTYTLADVARQFTASPEYTTKYEGLTTVQFVAQVYQNVLGRAADAEGLSYWSGQVTSGAIAQNDLVAKMLGSLGAVDQLNFDNRTAAAQEYTVEAGEDYDLEEAIEVVGSNAGSTLNLTDAVGESVVGSSANDTFTGVVGNGTTGTLQFGDQVNGAGGTDTLNLFNVNGTSTGIPSGVAISNVEIINIHDDAAGTSVNAAAFGSAAQQIWQVGSANDVTGLAQGQAAGFRNIDTVPAAAPSVNYAAAATTAAIALDEVADGFRFNVEGAGLTALNISGSVVDTDGEGTLAIGGAEGGVTNSLNALRTINIELSSNTELAVYTDALNAVTTINASASTGALDLDFSGLAGSELDLTSLSTGSGADDVAVNVDSFDSTAVSINLGAGNDVLTIDGTEGAAAAAASDLTAITVTLGAGRDTIEITSLSNVVEVDTTDNTVTQSAIIVTDFNASEDTLDLSALGLKGFYATQNLVDTAVSNVVTAGGSLADAIAAVDDYTAGSFAVQFDFGGNTYVYANSQAGEGLIQLNGDIALVGSNVLFDDVTASA